MHMQGKLKPDIQKAVFSISLWLALLGVAYEK